MSSPHLELLTAAITAVSVLAGVALQYWFSVLTSRHNQARENEQRWLADRLKANTRMVANSINLERTIWDVCSFLDDQPREERMPGFTSILLTPEGGIPGLFDELSREILVEGCEDAFKRLNKMELVVAEVELIGSPGEGVAALRLYDALWDAAGLIESYAQFSEAAGQVALCKKYREHLVDASRTSLGISGSIFEVMSARRHPSGDLS